MPVQEAFTSAMPCGTVRLGAACLPRTTSPREPCFGSAGPFRTAPAATSSNSLNPLAPMCWSSPLRQRRAPDSPSFPRARHKLTGWIMFICLTTNCWRSWTMACCGIMPRYAHTQKQKTKKMGPQPRHTRNGSYGNGPNQTLRFHCRISSHAFRCQGVQANTGLPPPGESYCWNSTYSTRDIKEGEQLLDDYGMFGSASALGGHVVFVDRGLCRL